MNDQHFRGVPRPGRGQGRTPRRTRLANRIRGLLTGLHPALERAIGSRISHPAELEILSRCGGPTGIAKAGRRKLTAIATAHAPRLGDKLVTAILAALEEQTVVVPGTTAADTVLPRLADSLKTVLLQRKQVATEVEVILDAHPLAEVLTSMPGIGVRTAARILLEIGDATGFKTSGHLAAYAGIAPSPAAPAAASKANTRPAPATANSHARSSSPRSPPSPTRPAAPTTSANATRARNTTPP
ncbi:hypothetical protein GCM10009634_58690 [Saccharothrix xinjiangensis]